MKKAFYYFLLVLILFLSSNEVNSQSFGFNLTEKRRKVEIEFEIINNLIIVPITLNKIPLKFILDSGVPTTILTERVISDVLQLKYERKLSIKGAGETGKMADAYIVRNVSIEMHGVESQGLSILVLDEDYLELKSFIGLNVQGILGYEIFRRFIVNINYEKKILTLYEPEYFKVRKNFYPIPISIEETKPYLKARLTYAKGESVVAKLMIDTGASQALFIERRWEAIIPDKKVKVNIGRGLSGEIRGYVGRIEKLSVGNFTFDNVISAFLITQDSVQQIQGRLGTIGGEILSRFEVTFDYFKGIMYVKKNRYYKKDFIMNMSGMELKADEANLKKIIVTNVLEKSPASEAGMLEGDIIKRLKGYTKGSFNLGDVYNALRSKEGKKVKIKIIREGKTLSKEIILRQLI